MPRVRCFGRVVIEDNDGREIALRSRKHAGLLLYLVSHARTVHTREDLAELLWEGTGPRERHSLSQALYDIRSNVDDLVEVTTSSVRLLPDRIDFDAADFERAVETGAHETALELYQGDFAPELANLGSDSFDRWIDAERERHRVLASIALRNAQRAAEERGDWDSMCLAALRLVRLNEFDEEAHCALMRGLCMKGDPASALRHYRNLSSDLVSGWRTVRELADRLERSGAVREVLTVPNRAIELIGREQEFEQLFDAYRRYGQRGGVVAVVGERGIGKTALLREFARLIEARGGLVTWAPGESVPAHTSDHLSASRSSSLHIVDPGDRLLEAAHQWNRLSGLLVLTSRQTTTEDTAGEMTQIDELVRLGRLREAELRLWAARAFGGVDERIREAAARISGGNPALFLGVLEAVSDAASTNGAFFDDRCLARAVTNASETLRADIKSLLESLSAAQLRVAVDLAVLSEAARAVYEATLEDECMQEALLRLRSEGLVVDRDGVSRLTHPLVASWLRETISRSEADAIRQRVIRLLREGPGTWRLAAATELAAAGRGDEAAGLAGEIVAGARTEGDSVLASRAARLASRVAPTETDRTRAALLAAEAELDRGRPRRAELVLRQLGDQDLGDSVRLQVDLALSRSLMEQGDTNGALAQSRSLTASAAAAVDPKTEAWARVQLAELVLAAETDSGRLTTAALNLETALRRTRAVAPQVSGRWLRGFTALFEHRIVYSGFEDAEGLLRAFSADLSGVSGLRYPASEVFRSVIELRAGRLDNALMINEALLRRATRAPDRFTSILLNNLGVILTELGRFVEADAAFQELGRIDAALCPPVPDRAHALINQAQARWFDAATDDALAHAESALQITTDRHQLVAAEGLALLGLMALEEGSESRARDLGDQVISRVSRLLPTQDDYLIVWFRAALRALEGEDPAEELEAVAQDISDRDHLAACKLRLLASRFQDRKGGGASVTDEAARELRRLGAGWFVRRTSRV